MVDLVHAGRRPEDLAKEFEPTAQKAAAWFARETDTLPDKGTNS